MSNQTNTLDLIIKHGLTVRQIPNSVTTRWTARPSEVVKPNETLVSIDGRTLFEKTTIPKSAGKWMAKACNNTDSMVRWNIKTDNLSDTLDEAVSKAVASLPTDEQPQS